MLHQELLPTNFDQTQTPGMPAGIIADCKVLPCADFQPSIHSQPSIQSLSTEPAANQEGFAAESSWALGWAVAGNVVAGSVFLGCLLLLPFWLEQLLAAL